MTTMVNPTWTQTLFRARNDNGNETTATWKANLNTNWTQAVDEIFRVRFAITESAGATQTNTPQFIVQYNLNGAGYVSAATSGTAVLYVGSDNVTDDANTTQQISSGTFQAGKIDENGTHTALGSMSNEVTEMEWVLSISSGSVSNNDTIALRVTLADTTVLNGGYSQTPTITVSEAVSYEDLVAAAGSFTLTGVAAIMTTARKMTATVGEFTLTGIDATLAKTVMMTAEAGSFTLTGIDTGITATRTMTAALGEFTLTGIDATLAKTVVMPATVGEFTLTGTATGLQADRTLGIIVGEFTYSGIDAAFTRALIMPVTVGEFTYTGIDAGLLAAYKFTADNTTYTMTSVDATLTYNESTGSYSMAVSTGEFEIDGNRVNIRFAYRIGWKRFKSVTPAKIHRNKSRSDIMRYDDGSWEAR